MGTLPKRFRDDTLRPRGLAPQAIFLFLTSQAGPFIKQWRNKRMVIIKGMKFESPRGPVEIDPQTRDIIQNIYLRRANKVNGVHQNTEIAVHSHVKDPIEK